MIYLDNNSTTPVCEEVVEAMRPYLQHEFGNPSSKYYQQAVNAKKAIEEARCHVASLINADPTEILFTAGASEANNMIIKGIADFEKYYGTQRNHIITSSVEHESVLNTCKFLNGEIYSNRDATLSFSDSLKVDRGYIVDFLSVNQYGQVTPDTLKASLTDNTSIVSIIWGNNEIGSLNDIDSIGKVCRANNTYFHSDGTQVLGRVPIDVRKTIVDFLSFSAHKLNGPKGVGCLYLKQDKNGALPLLTALIHGGEQEEGLRAGTYAVHNIVGFGKAAELAKKELNIKIATLKSLENELKKGLQNAIPDIEFLGDPVNKVPGVLSIIIHKEMFYNELFIRKVSPQLALSTGSACTAGKPSHVVSGIGRKIDTRKVIRISIDHMLSTTLINNICTLFNENI